MFGRLVFAFLKNGVAFGLDMLVNISAFSFENCWKMWILYP